jgi:hypothetical protein
MEASDDTMPGLVDFGPELFMSLSPNSHAQVFEDTIRSIENSLLWDHPIDNQSIEPFMQVVSIEQFGVAPAEANMIYDGYTQFMDFEYAAPSQHLDQILIPGVQPSNVRPPGESLAPVPRNGGAKWATGQDWCRYRAKIVRLYWLENHTLPQVRRIMAEDHGFQAR